MKDSKMDTCLEDHQLFHW